MTEKKHTPGPWRVTTDFEYMRNFNAIEHVEIQGANKVTIGCCLFDCLTAGRSNAALIASAPDLLEAAKMATKAMKCHPQAVQDEEINEARDNLLDAIAKAEGGGDSDKSK